MKGIGLFFGLLLCWVLCGAQNPVIVTQPYKFTKWVDNKGSVYLDSILNVGDSTNKASSTGWVKQLLAEQGGGGTVPGGAITSVPVVGFNPGTGLTPSAWITAVYYASQPPTATLSGGTVYELTISGETHNLNYSYGRQSATATISTAVVTPGPLNVFSTQPAQPGTVSGSQSVTTAANTNTTYTITVTTSDGKTATAATIDSFLPRFFYGYSSVASPTSSQLLAFAGGGDPLSGSHAQHVVITASGSNYPFFSYQSSLGAVTLIQDVNGFNVTSAFNQTTVTFTNSQGYSQTNYVYTLNAATASSYTITTN